MVQKLQDHDRVLQDVSYELARIAAKSADLQALLDASLACVSARLTFERATLALMEDGGQSCHVQTLLETRPHVPPMGGARHLLAHDIIAATIQTHEWRLLNRADMVREELPLESDPAMWDGSLASILLMPLEAHG